MHSGDYNKLEFQSIPKTGYGTHDEHERGWLDSLLKMKEHHVEFKHARMTVLGFNVLNHPIPNNPMQDFDARKYPL